MQGGKWVVCSAIRNMLTVCARMPQAGFHPIHKLITLKLFSSYLILHITEFRDPERHGETSPPIEVTRFPKQNPNCLSHSSSSRRGEEGERKRETEEGYREDFIMRREKRCMSLSPGMTREGWWFFILYGVDSIGSEHLTTADTPVIKSWLWF